MMLKYRTIELLKRKEKYYTQMSELCKKILNQDKSMAQIFQNSNISLPAFRNQALREDVSYNNFRYNRQELLDLTTNLMSPEEKIFKDTIKLLDDIPYFFIEFPADFESTIQAILKESIKDNRDYDIMIRIYYQNQRYEDIGKIYSISPQRIHQIKNRYLNYMKRSDRIQRMILGDIEYNRYIKNIESQKEILYEKYCTKIDLDNIPIDVLNITDGLKFNLNQRNVHTINQIMEISDQDLLSIPHVGRKSLDKIKFQINKYLKGDD